MEQLPRQRPLLRRLVAALPQKLFPQSALVGHLLAQCLPQWLLQILLVEGNLNMAKGILEVAQRIGESLDKIARAKDGGGTYWASSLAREQ